MNGSTDMASTDRAPTHSASVDLATSQRERTHRGSTHRGAAAGASTDVRHGQRALGPDDRPGHRPIGRRPTVGRHCRSGQVQSEPMIALCGLVALVVLTVLTVLVLVGPGHAT